MYKAFKTHDFFKITNLFTLFEDTFPLCYDFEGESHDFWECVYVQEGSICVYAGDRTYFLEKGDIIFHKPLEFHKYHMNDTVPTKLFIFSFTLEERNNAFFEDKVFKLNPDQQNILAQLKGFLNRKNLFPNEKCQSHCYYVLQKIFSEEKSAVNISIVLNYIYGLFLSICDYSVILDETVLTHTLIFKKAVNYMTENICRTLSIVDIAKHCAISTTSLKKIFLEFAGIGVHKYFLNLKINHAKLLLSDGMSVNKVTQMLGFSNQAYFSAAFKRETGYPPSKYHLSI